MGLLCEVKKVAEGALKCGKIKTESTCRVTREKEPTYSRLSAIKKDIFLFRIVWERRGIGGELAEKRLNCR